ncbi:MULTISPECIES: DeoR/GlpR family DNA-binding transcription regulator [unclassified Enterococcus]|uniref:DeoR/GlpR family DNA-binding transcription regulator n=1 Tax=unclassified Enterococcus TaxID=2608891 RepID=UPI0015579173|nr:MULTISPECIES: DeoR/GlpR family DNA-binding transcription regulator [unclassified Enterococcus]MBS7577938.1 DeoR/GlpR transcriptional regulator [Enterococcus sp. MMGLQ5-2]MBS7585201.1 DeoR/GlpR transcriptional regulator [Enterococcus sp. MMGLQ5-1]NPD13058.1 DeoR/GlpR transcriptional regulator [Enterococcus sp. MMGLQ5-1]NPD37768.1 DeoR/GlpR transcriptional regulator [Enterococcus sp. MMGLQ5-2]
MYQEQRIAAILKLLNQQGQLSIKEIMQKLNISRDTARRDIIETVETGRAVRTHGGIISAKQSFPVLDFFERQKDLNPNRTLLAQRTAELIKPNAVYFIDVSTILLELTKQIASKCRVYTHALDNATVLSSQPEVALTLLGGDFDHKNRFFYSQESIEIIDNIKFDLALIGGASLEADGIYFKEPENAKLKRHVVKNAHRVVLVAENRKFFKQSNYKGASYSDIDILITDQPLTKQQRKLFSEETQIIEVLSD